MDLMAEQPEPIHVACIKVQLPWVILYLRMLLIDQPDRDREQHLLFDKSQIHGWGVYAETPISMGDMIIEYRGELIGNAVADKREKEYEKLKMDDYMFRIDTCTVCDATMLGNVARYINASCSPNCYTQIITAGENKRIVIYAKRDIRREEELCYMTTNSIWKKINVNVSHVTVVQ